MFCYLWNYKHKWQLNRMQIRWSNVRNNRVSIVTDLKLVRTILFICNIHLLKVWGYMIYGPCIEVPRWINHCEATLVVNKVSLSRLVSWIWSSRGVISLIGVLPSIHRLMPWFGAQLLRTTTMVFIWVKHRTGVRGGPIARRRRSILMLIDVEIKWNRRGGKRRWSDWWLTKMSIFQASFLL